jgi:hypothetical protein
LKKEIESKCRLCKQHEETSGCPILAKKEYLMRHGKVCTRLHYSIRKALGIETTDKWYTHMPKSVYEEEFCVLKSSYWSNPKLNDKGRTVSFILCS